MWSEWLIHQQTLRTIWICELYDQLSVRAPYVWYTMHSGSHSSFRDCFPRRKKYSATLHLSIDSHAFIHLTFSRPGALWGPQTLFCCQSPWNMASNEIPSKTDLQHERKITPTPSQWLTARHPPIIPFCIHQRHSQTDDCTKKILTSGIQNESVKRWDLVHRHHHHHHPQPHH